MKGRAGFLKGQNVSVGLKMLCNQVITPGLAGLCLLVGLLSGVLAAGQESSPDAAEVLQPVIEEENIVEGKGQSELALFENIPTVVTASKKRERVTAAPAIVSIITAEDIQRMGARNIMDVLRTIPGVEIMKDAWNISQIAVRGLRHAESSAGVKILIDGHALNDPITGGATEFYEDLPLKNIRRIEIIRGPASALYGSNAFVSVINILTKSAQDIDGVEVNLGGGLPETVNPSFLIGKILTDLEISVYADYYKTRGAKLLIEADAMSVYDREDRPSGVSPVSLAPGFFREDREQLFLSSKLVYHDVTLQVGFLHKQRGPFLTDQYVLNDGSNEMTQHLYANLEYRHFFTERLELQGKLYADYFNIDLWTKLAPGIAFPALNGDEAVVYPNGVIEQYAMNSWRVGGENQINYRLFRNNDLTVGLAYEYLAVEDVHIRTNRFNYEYGYPLDELIALATFIPDLQTSESQWLAALFVQDTWRIRRNFELTLGFRSDYYSTLTGRVQVTPKIGIVYEPDRRFNIKLLLGSAFRIPSFYESLMERAIQDNSRRTDLAAEELVTTELGISYKPVEWLVGEINYFYTHVEELAEIAEGETASAPVDPEDRYENIGGIDVQGVEVELRGTLERSLGLGIIPRVMRSVFRINYSYQDPQDSTTHAKVPNMARHKGNIGVGFDLSAAQSDDSGRNPLSVFRTLSDEFSLYANLFICGERQRSPRDLRKPLPAFAILDMTLTAHDLFHTGVGLSFSVKNLLDEDYRDPSPEYSVETRYATIPGDFPTPGRSFFLELRYTF